MLFLIIALTACQQEEATSPTAQSPAPASEEAPATPTVQAPAQAEESTHELAGTQWQLVEIASMDDSTFSPDDPASYTLAFGEDGTAAIVADCNRGSGRWTSGSASQLEFGPIAATMALCPEESLSEKYLAQFEWVRSYTMKDGHLFLATMADGSIIEFAPLVP